MGYLTLDQLRDWVADQEEDSLYCEFCLHQLSQLGDGKWYCPNEMCLNDEQYELVIEE